MDPAEQGQLAEEILARAEAEWGHRVPDHVLWDLLDSMASIGARYPDLPVLCDNPDCGELIFVRSRRFCGTLCQHAAARAVPPG